jgi:hypothetical protein
MPIESVIVEAGGISRQRELIRALQEADREIILDTNVAELSCQGKFDGHATGAPWADPEGPLTPEHFVRGANYDIVGKIARCAVEHGVNVVQSPAHMLVDSNSLWLTSDRNSCIALRRALDSEGGKNIAIDYPLMTTFAALRDPVQRRVFLTSLVDLPFDNLWIRISGFGSEATPIGIRRYIGAITDLLRLEKPVIADGIGGLAALATVAFGAAGGTCHGVAEKERFDASDWDEPRGSGGGGSQKRILIPGLDRHLNIKQMESLMAAQGGRRICGCHDRSCCPHGWEDTQKDPKGHYLYQRSKQIRALSSVPDLRRIQHFLDHDLDDANRIARTAARIKTTDDSLRETLSSSKERLEKMFGILEELQKTIGDGPRSAAPQRRLASGRGAARGRR